MWVERYSDAGAVDGEIHMTQQFLREAITLGAALVSFARAVFPKPIIERNNKPYENQLIARLGYIAFGLFLLFVWHGIRVEGMPHH